MIGPVTRTDFVRYQGASGDMNPIHHDEAFARAAGFPTPFAVGMWPAGLLGAYATSWLGPENVRSLPDPLPRNRCGPATPSPALVSVVREYEQDGEQRVDIELTCRRQTGGVAVTVWSTFVRPEEGEDVQ